jgi:hypothetical protein
MATANPNLPGLPEDVREHLRSSRREEALTENQESQSLLTSAPTVIMTWDRRSLKTDKLTGREVPDETKRVPLLAYANPRPAEWPAADFIVGNPPFIGTARMREDLGDGYAETLRATYPEVPESADFVLYWWHKAATLVRAGQAQRFGLITTNSLRQTFARRVVQIHLSPEPESNARPHPDPLPRGEGTATKRSGNSKTVGSDPARGAILPLLGERAGVRADVTTKSTPLSLVFAIPDHPWVDTADGAAVRIAMTVGAAGEHPGELLEVTDEQPQDDGSEKVTFNSQRGAISADLTVGADVTTTIELKANEGLANRGFCLFGAGFIVSQEKAKELGLGKIRSLENYIRPYRNGKDLTDKPRDVMVIDLYGMTGEEVRERFPATYQHVLTHVKPERDENRRESRRVNWWIFGEPNKQLRKMLEGLPRYIGITETSKFRIFQFLDAGITPDNKIVVIALNDAFHLGVLSSRVHVVYALAAGSWLGVGNDPVYAKSRCFDPFPFPLCGEAEQERIRKLAEELDAHRKRVQAQHGLTLTGLYNVLEKLRAAEASRAVPPHPNPLPPGEGTASTRSRKSKAPDSDPARRTILPLPAGEGQGEGECSNQPAVAFPLTAREKLIHDHGLVSVLKQLHDDLDRAVADAYGWPWPLSDQEILERLVALNAERAAEEQRGIIHWLRPEYQTRGQKPEVRSQKELRLPEGKTKPRVRQSPIGNRQSKMIWPKSLAERVKAVETALHSIGVPTTPAELARQFKRAKPEQMAEILETLVTLGRAHRKGNQFTR